MFGLGATEWMILIFIAVFVVGPERMPRYAKELAQYIRKIREMSESAKSQMKEELGEDYAQLADIRKYDPRQYDPRQILKQALTEDITGVFDEAKSTVDDVKNTVTQDVLGPAKDTVESTVQAVNPSNAANPSNAVQAATAAVASGVSYNNSPEENVRLARQAATQRPGYVELPAGFAAPFDPEAT